MTNLHLYHLYEATYGGFILSYQNLHWMFKDTSISGVIRILQSGEGWPRDNNDNTFGKYLGTLDQLPELLI